MGSLCVQDLSRIGLWVVSTPGSYWGFSGPIGEWLSCRWFKGCWKYQWKIFLSDSIISCWSSQPNSKHPMIKIDIWSIPVWNKKNMIKQRFCLLCVSHASCIGSTLCGIWRLVPTYALDVGRCHPARPCPAHFCLTFSVTGPTYYFMLARWTLAPSIFAHQKPNLDVITAFAFQERFMISILFIHFWGMPSLRRLNITTFWDAILHHPSKDWA